MNSQRVLAAAVNGALQGLRKEFVVDCATFVVARELDRRNRVLEMRKYFARKGIDRVTA